MGAQANQPSADAPEDVKKRALNAALEITGCGLVSNQRIADVVSAAILADRQAREEARDGGGWRTIDSAPRDGTWVLIATHQFVGGVVLARWSRTNQHFVDIDQDDYFDASHWMPTPAPPAIEPSPVEGDRR